jgi:hypothetical protein
MNRKNKISNKKILIEIILLTDLKYQKKIKKKEREIYNNKMIIANNNIKSNLNINVKFAKKYSKAYLHCQIIKNQKIIKFKIILKLNRQDLKLK